ncbi:MAG: response regulator [Minisyncoccota bacterium]
METAPAAKKKILWVEDDSFLIDIIAQKLTQEQWELLYANDGAAALRVAHEKKPDAIILDILLPGIDGIEVLRQLKADEETKNIPVLMFSNLDDKEKIAQGKELGAEGFFIKATSTLESIIEEIQKVLAR